MMQSTAKNLADLLVSRAVGTLATDLFIGKEPDEPDACITLYDTGGGDQNPKLAISQSTVMVRARDNKYPDCYQQMELVKMALEGLPITDVAGGRIVGIWASSNIALLGYDEKNRAIMTINFNVNREPTERGYRQQS